MIGWPQSDLFWNFTWQKILLTHICSKRAEELLMDYNLYPNNISEKHLALNQKDCTLDYRTVTQAEPQLDKSLPGWGQFSCVCFGLSAWLRLIFQAWEGNWDSAPNRTPRWCIMHDALMCLRTIKVSVRVMVLTLLMGHSQQGNLSVSIKCVLTLYLLEH